MAAANPTMNNPLPFNPDMDELRARMAAQGDRVKNRVEQTGNAARETYGRAKEGLRNAADSFKDRLKREAIKKGGKAIARVILTNPITWMLLLICGLGMLLVFIVYQEWNNLYTNYIGMPMMTYYLDKACGSIPEHLAKKMLNSGADTLVDAGEFLDDLTGDVPVVGDITGFLTREAREEQQELDSKLRNQIECYTQYGEVCGSVEEPTGEEAFISPYNGKEVPCRLKITDVIAIAQEQGEDVFEILQQLKDAAEDGNDALVKLGKDLSSL